MEPIVEPGPDDPICVSMRRGATQLIWFNNPRHRNALSLAMRELAIPEMIRAMDDPTVRCVVVAGAGGCFSAGGDIRGMAGTTVGQGRQRLRNVHRLVRAMTGGPKPVIAAVEGWAVGAGLSIAVACDIVVAASDARFSMPFGKIGLMPDLGVLHTLPARIGIGRTRWLALTGRAVDAETAAAWGIADELVAPGEAVAHALALAEEIAAGAPIATAVTKQALSRGLLPLDDVLATEVDAQSMLFGTRDFAEGTAAFLEKRTPTFTGE